MKKAFLYYFLAFFTVLTTLTVSSCSKDDKDDDDEPSVSSIVGTWKITEVVIDDYDDFLVGDTFTFKKDGTVIIDWYEDGEVWTEYGEYVLDGSRIRMYLEEEGSMSGTVSVSGSKMELRFNWEGDSYYLILKKK